MLENDLMNVFDSKDVKLDKDNFGNSFDVSDVKVNNKGFLIIPLEEDGNDYKQYLSKFYGNYPILYRKFLERYPELLEKEFSVIYEFISSNQDKSIIELKTKRDSSFDVNNLCLSSSIKNKLYNFYKKLCELRGIKVGSTIHVKDVEVIFSNEECIMKTIFDLLEDDMKKREDLTAEEIYSDDFKFSTAMMFYSDNYGLNYLTDHNLELKDFISLEPMNYFNIDIKTLCKNYDTIGKFYEFISKGFHNNRPKYTVYKTSFTVKGNTPDDLVFKNEDINNSLGIYVGYLNIFRISADNIEVLD